jgi:hypothetical protein
MRLSKSAAVSLEGDRIGYSRMTVARTRAEQSLTILTSPDAVKPLGKFLPLGKFPGS